MDLNKMDNLYLQALAKIGIESAHPGGLTLTKQLLNTEKIDKNTHILDIGCGTGATAELIYKEFQSPITACDLDPIMVEKANTRFKESNIPLKAIEGNIESLPFRDQFFDLVISESVIAFTNVNRSLKELSRVLKPKGRLIAIEMCKAENVTDIELKSFKDFYQVSEIFTIANWKDVLTTNFNSVEVNEFIPEVHNQDEMISMELLDLSDFHIYDIFLKHIELVQQYHQKVFPCIIKALK